MLMVEMMTIMMTVLKKVIVTVSISYFHCSYKVRGTDNHIIELM